MSEIQKEIIQIDGGIGRCIDFTGVLKKYCEKNPNKKVDVICPHADIFFNMSWINKVYPINTPYLFETAIKDARYIKPEPYDMYEYYTEMKHITQCFDKQLTGEEELVLPVIQLSQNELKQAEMWVAKHKQETGKDIILFQPHGSSGGKGTPKPDGTADVMPDESGRSLDQAFAEKLAKELQKDYEVFIIKNQDQVGIKDFKTFQGLTLRQIFALIPYVKAGISCDTFLSHAFAMFGKKCYVLWGATSPKNLGYETNMNFTPEKEPTILPNRLPHNMFDTFKQNGEIINGYGDKEIKIIVEDIKNGNKKLDSRPNSRQDSETKSKEGSVSDSK